MPTSGAGSSSSSTDAAALLADVPAGRALVLYDGTCGFCSSSVRFLLDRDGAHDRFRFAALQSARGERLQSLYPELAQVDSIVVVERFTDGRPHVRIKSDAALRLVRLLPALWPLLGWLGLVLPRALRDALYDGVARSRHRLMGRRDACALLAPAERAKFLDG